MLITKEEKHRFSEDGFIHLKNFLQDESILGDVINEITQIGQHVIGPEFSTKVFDRNIITKEKQSLLYDRLHYMLSLSRLSSLNRIMDLLIELGVELPALMGCCNMRFDPPNNTEHLFDWHQDTLYLLGSLNAVTVWIPFGKVDKEHGSIEVIPASHKNGILPFKTISNKPIMDNVQFLQRDIALDMPVTQSATLIEAELGDIVVFNQMLLHRSIKNVSQLPRWSAQLRVSDLMDSWFIKNKCPTGDKKNIFYCDYPGFQHKNSRL